MSQVTERSILGNIKFMISGLANAVGTTTNAVNEIAKTAESLASTANVMAENNKELVIAESNFKLKQAMNEFTAELDEWEANNK